MSRLTQYAYDLSRNIGQKSLANGLKEVRSHDGRNRVSTLDNQASGGGNVAGYAYGYDRAGNVMEVEETYPSGELSNRTIINSYDGVYRLLTEAITTGGSTVTSTYVYDKGHNRTSQAVSGGATTTYVIGNGSNGAGANQIVSATTGGVTTAYAYDANGNRTSRTIGSASDIYSYDDDNRLINLNYQTGTSGLGTYAYGYDYRTRRVARTEPGPVRTNIVFDGGTSIIEYGAGGAASPNVEYIRGHDYGGGVGGLEYSVRSGAASFNFYDSRGDVTTQTSAAGAVTYQAAYEAFGDQTATSGSTLDRQKANTKEEDPTGLLNEGFRYRDPETGTFITRDPLGFKAGPNMYCYVHQNPWTKFDPEGLLDIEINGKTVPWTPVNQAKAFIQNAKDFFGGAGERLSEKGAALKRGATTSPLTTVPQLARSIVNSASNFYNDPIHATAISPDAFTPRGLGRTSVDMAQALVTQELGGAAFSRSKIPETTPGGNSPRVVSESKPPAAPPVPDTYHRFNDSPDNISSIQKTGKLWGGPTRYSEIPQVNAHPGPIPPGAGNGFEFTTIAKPSGPPGALTGSAFHLGNPGVIENAAGKAQIDVTVTKIQPKPPSVTSTSTAKGT